MTEKRSPTSPADKLRIIIALTVLKLKPKDVSLQSYVLHLRSIFPPSKPAPLTADHSWKLYALKLESDYHRLREQYEEQATKLLALSSNTDKTVSDPNTNAANHLSEIVTKKQAKKKLTSGSDNNVLVARDLHPDWSVMSKGLLNQLQNDLPWNADLMLALEAFVRATADAKANDTTLLQVTLRTLRAASKLLGSLLDSSTARKSHHIAFSVLSDVSIGVLNSSLCSLIALQKPTPEEEVRLDGIDNIFDCLIDDLFRPIIHSFWLLSHSAFLRILEGETSGPDSVAINSVDIRPDLLNLFYVLVETVSTVSPGPLASGEDQEHRLRLKKWNLSLLSLRASLVLEIVRELEKILFPTTQLCGITPVADNAESRVDHRTRLTVPNSEEQLYSRIKQLSAKDALWYLCTLLHILASFPMPPQESTSFGFPTRNNKSSLGKADSTGLVELLHEATISGLCGLILKCRPVNYLQENEFGTNLNDTPAELPKPFRDSCNDGHDTNDGNTQAKSLSEDISSSKAVNDIQNFGVDVSKAGLHCINGNVISEPNKQERRPIPSNNGKPPRIGELDQYSLLFDNVDSHVGNTPATVSQRRESSKHFSQGQSLENNNSDMSNSALSETEPESGVKSSSLTKARGECLVDEAGYLMLLAVVERFILDSEYYT